MNARHSMIEERLRQEQGRPLPDAAAIASMKKQKLRIKDALADGR
jgi:hypothetical protein